MLVNSPTMSLTNILVINFLFDWLIVCVHGLMVCLFELFTCWRPRIINSGGYTSKILKWPIFYKQLLSCSFLLRIKSIGMPPFECFCQIKIWHAAEWMFLIKLKLRWQQDTMLWTFQCGVITIDSTQCSFWFFSNIL